MIPILVTCLKTENMLRIKKKMEIIHTNQNFRPKKSTFSQKIKIIDKNLYYLKKSEFYIKNRFVRSRVSQLRL